VRVLPYLKGGGGRREAEGSSKKRRKRKEKGAEPPLPSTPSGERERGDSNHLEE